MPAGAAPLDGAERRVALLAVVATGSAALLCQVAWQRTIALHAGVDLESSVTVVAAFLAGLGVGSLVGGVLADRLARRQALVVLGATTTALAAVTFVSVTVLYEGYREVAPHLDALATRVGFNVALLLVPTVLQGLSLPLLARSITSVADDAASDIGRFNAANTIGAALGASAGGWLLLGSFGLGGAVRLAALLQVVAAAAFLLLGLGGRRLAAEGRGPTSVPRAVAAGVVVAGSAWFAGLVAGALPRVGGAWPLGAVLGGGGGGRRRPSRPPVTAVRERSGPGSGPRRRTLAGGLAAGAGAALRSALALVPRLRRQRCGRPGVRAGLLPPGGRDHPLEHLHVRPRAVALPGPARDRRRRRITGACPPPPR